MKNYQKNNILWYGHLCMRGRDDVVEEPLHSGTEKSAEGHLAKKLAQEAKEEEKITRFWWIGRTVTPHQLNPSWQCTHQCLLCIVQACWTGTLYESRFVQSCELHSLGYEAECKTRVSNAESILGQRYSNLGMAAFSILPRCAKNLAIHCLSYITLTNFFPGPP